jgi:hypothetical protein
MRSITPKPKLMAPSPLNNVKVQLSGLLKSSHALLGLLAIIAAVLFAVSLAGKFIFGEYLFAAVFAILLVSVLIRYQIKGPESEQLQPSVSLTHQENQIHAQFVNFDFQQNMTAQMVAVFQAVLSRRPLPPPSGIIEGSVSDPNAVRPITIEMAKALQETDSQLPSPPNVSATTPPPTEGPNSSVEQSAAS